MTVLSYIAIAILAIILIIVVLFYLAKGLVNLMFLLLRLLPTMIKATIYWAIVVTLCFILEVPNKLPDFPGIIYPLLYLAIFVLLLVRRFVKHGSVFGSSGGEYKGYVLNKKSKVIHEKYSDSEGTISSHHKRELSYSEAMELINNNGKYHFKK